MKELNKYVGLDVHKDSTVVAVAEAGRAGGVRVHGTISSDLGALEKVLRKRGSAGVALHVDYYGLTVEHRPGVAACGKLLGSCPRPRPKAYPSARRDYFRRRDRFTVALQI